MPPLTALTMRASSNGSKSSSPSSGETARRLSRTGPSPKFVTMGSLKPSAARDGHAVPATLTVVEELVAGDAEGKLRDVAVGQLRLLQEQDIRRSPLEPPLDGLEAGAQRVDVPGRDAHRRRL